MQRPSKRQPNQLRPITIQRQFTKHAEGSAFICFGDTKVITTASVAHEVPKFLKGSNQGWITAEYGMLPRSTHERNQREASRGKQGGRTLEIQRLIGRSLRAAVDLQALANYTIYIDCDVIQADGGTRTAAITGACIALTDALQCMLDKKMLSTNPLTQLIAAVSVGIYQGVPVLDLDYAEDGQANTDMNVVMTENGKFIEIQGTAETASFSRSEFNALLDLAEQGIRELFTIQHQALKS